MTKADFLGLLLVWLASSGMVAWRIWREYCRCRFTFNMVFSLLYWLTFFFGFPLTGVLVFRFSITTADPINLLLALLSAAGFYGLYDVCYHARLWPARAPVPRALAHVNRHELHLSAALLALVAFGTAAVFFAHNGLLLFKLSAYNQIFSRDIAGVALKRFFYFFIPAMLMVYFQRQTRRAWLLFLLVCAAFGGFTYLLVGGTRANILIAVALFLLIGLQQRWLRWWMLALAGALAVLAMFGLALLRYRLAVQGDEAFYTFLYLTRDTFSPWQNLATLWQHQPQTQLQGLAPIVRDFYVFIPTWLWPERPAQVLNTANYFTWEVLGYHAGLAMSPTVLGSLLVMGGPWLLAPGALVVAMMIKGFDALYRCAQHSANRALSALLQSFCFGALFNLVVLVREGLDAFFSRMVFFCLIFSACVLLAKGIYALLLRMGMVTSGEGHE
ncbi:ECA oligosaccharide polymerase [Dickeya lacustris]|uniref:ECA oligosaccharide polymerase n=1 Tax=Dickeya lacustris TaxID=2259638 RepID=A0ABY8G3N1_9GAMM|nr:ECA oligosaccharide polymerase [Dickeya lacustris]WFN54560.1 ECA oligosaccharide polymerase [Dickeya lacustris]